MRQRAGRLIHKSVSERGVVEVMEDGSSRSLYFGTHARQSSMLLEDPITLALEYTQAMITALLFNRDPDNALLIGLGGGSLAKFLLHHCPGCRIDVVECNEDVVKLALGYFALPDEERMRIHLADGAEFVEAGVQRYDLMLVDAFDRYGVPGALMTEAFFDDCHARLTDDGVFAINLWGSDRKRFAGTLARIDRVFAGQVLKLPVQGVGNVVVLAFKRRLEPDWPRRLKASALELRDRLGVDLPRFLRTLHKSNSSLLKRLFV